MSAFKMNNVDTQHDVIVMECLRPGYCCVMAVTEEGEGEERTAHRSRDISISGQWHPHWQCDIET